MVLLEGKAPSDILCIHVTTTVKLSSFTVIVTWIVLFCLMHVFVVVQFTLISTVTAP